MNLELERINEKVFAPVNPGSFSVVNEMIIKTQATNYDAYLDKLLPVGFDGAYLNIIDGFEYFENQ